MIVSNAFSQEVIKSSDLEVKFKEIYCLKDIKEDDCDEIFNKKKQGAKVYCHKIDKSDSVCKDYASKAIISFKKIRLAYGGIGRAPAEEVRKKKRD